MGQGTAVRTSKASKRAVSKKDTIRLKIDVPLTLITITLVVFGLIIMYSASWDFSWLVFGSPTLVLTRQLIWLGIGIVLLVVFIWVDYHYWQRLALLGIGVTIVLLIAVLFIGEERHGATRGLLAGSIQPSEMAKLITVIYLGVWLYSKRDQLSDINFGLIPLGVILGVLGGLIISQPDLSATATVLFLGGILFFLAGGDLKQMAFLVVLTFLVGWFVVKVNPTGNERITSYIAGLKDPTDSSYHVRRSLEAFVRGGWFGVGIGKGITKLTGLPFPHTDSIFAVVGEETGWVGSSIVVGLFGGLLWRGMTISRRAPDGLGKILAAGLSMWIAMEAFINMAAMVGLVPFAGNTLPFFSSGGSNLVVTLIAVGILLNISRLSEYAQQEVERRSISEVVDLRRWNGWRGVSRPGGSPASDR